MALASVMATLMVRGLDEEVRRRLKDRAASNARSMEAEVRAILSAAVMPHDPDPGAGSSVTLPVTAPGPLTAQEDRIAALVAQGWSNRQIADSFALSERTVEAHVSAILRMVGVRNRAAVASWYTARGAAPVPH